MSRAAAKEALKEALRAVRAATRRFPDAADGSPASELRGSLLRALARCEEGAAHQRRRQLFLGLDISSTSSGFAVLDGTSSCLHCDVIQPPRASPVLPTGKFIERAFKDLYEMHGVDTEWDIVIEDHLAGFNAGRSRNKSMIKLAKVNGISEFLACAVFGSVPKLVHPTSCRAFFQLNTTPDRDDTKGSQGVKDRVFEYVKMKDATVDWKGDKSDFDRSDAYLLAMYSRALWLHRQMMSDSDLWKSICRLDRIEDMQKFVAKDDFEKLEKALLLWLRCAQAGSLI